MSENDKWHKTALEEINEKLRLENIKLQSQLDKALEDLEAQKKLTEKAWGKFDKEATKKLKEHWLVVIDLKKEKEITKVLTGALEKIENSDAIVSIYDAFNNHMPKQDALAKLENLIEYLNRALRKTERMRTDEKD